MYANVYFRLLAQSLQLFRSGLLKPIVEPKVFDASQVIEAFRHFSSATRIGKIAVSFEKNDDSIEAVPERYDTKFDPEKAYFLVGCLGGLGRSISRWMVSRGARNFIFLGRSGSTKPEAQSLVEDLARHGSTVSVVRGDVSSFRDVRQALRKASAPIGGVVQAAMALDVSDTTLTAPRSANLLCRKRCGQPCLARVGILQSTQRFRELGTFITLSLSIRKKMSTSSS